MGAKILIVDDDVEFASILKKRIHSMGYDARVTNDAVQAVSAAHQYQPDLVLLDVSLPAGGGADVLRNLQFSANTSTIPVVIVTGQREEEVSDEIKTCSSVQAIVTKPYEPSFLQNLLNEIIGS